MAGVLTPSMEAEVTLAIYHGDETVHKLDNKYLDLDWLPGIEKKDILPLQTVETTTTTDQKYYFAHVPYNGAEFWGTEISAGKKITVEVNGRPYECVVSGDAMDGFMAYTGSVGLTFVNEFIVVTTTGSQTLTLRVYIPDHKKMPVEYLPVGGTELGAVKNGGNVVINEDGTMTAPDSGGNGDLTGYATEQWVKDQKYLTEVPEGYAKTEDIPSLDGYAKTEDIPSLDGYAKTEDVPTDAEIIQLIKDNAPEPSGGGIAVTGATVGQTVKIAEVDENGVPTAWEAVDPITGADWNAAEGEPGHILNRPFYLEKGNRIVEETTLYGNHYCDGHLNLTLGKEYLVIYNGTEYIFTAKVFNEIEGEATLIGLGNHSLLYAGAENTGEPIVIATDTFEGGYWSIYTDRAVIPYTVSVYEIDEIVKIPEKYLPDGYSSGGNVAYDEAQNLTEEQKAQARENIGAQPNGNYLTEVPEGYAKTEDIPTDDHINSLINTALGVIENGTY
jgi:hypothetical protein